MARIRSRGKLSPGGKSVLPGGFGNVNHNGKFCVAGIVIANGQAAVLMPVSSISASLWISLAGKHFRERKWQKYHSVFFCRYSSGRQLYGKNIISQTEDALQAVKFIGIIRDSFELDSKVRRQSLQNYSCVAPCFSVPSCED